MVPRILVKRKAKTHQMVLYLTPNPVILYRMSHLAIEGALSRNAIYMIVRIRAEDVIYTANLAKLARLRDVIPSKCKALMCVSNMEQRTLIFAKWMVVRSYLLVKHCVSIIYQSWPTRRNIHREIRQQTNLKLQQRQLRNLDCRQQTSLMLHLQMCRRNLNWWQKVHLKLHLKICQRNHKCLQQMNLKLHLQRCHRLTTSFLLSRHHR
mmetsp:Transcript_28103/g.47774  ORF Transcript_28103/g.47774 Transcript_28103/m.47774 type:complete len:208 (+) Transcript_28103:1874-2497(+)